MPTRHAEPAIQVRRAAERFVTSTEGLDSRHSFSFGRHYDGANTSHGLLLAYNEDVVRPGAGYPTHPHRDVEIVTWVLQGSLVHRDSNGYAAVIHPGLVQRLSAGSGVLHSETNDSALPGGASCEQPVHFVQMWVAPDQTGLAPGYQLLDVGQALLGGDLVPVASGMPEHAGAAAVRIASRSAALHAARLVAGQSVVLPEAPYLHLSVTRGQVDLEGVGPLAPGDAVRCTDTGGQRVTAGQPLPGSATAEVLVWEMHRSLR